MYDAKFNTPIWEFFRKAVLAGVLISIGAAFMLFVRADLTLNPAMRGVLSGLCFSVGLFGVMCSGAELFTGDCLMLLGVVDGERYPEELMHRLVVAYLGNLVGALATVVVVNACVPDFCGAALTLATAKSTLPWWIAMARGIGCNVLVCLAVWSARLACSPTGRFFSCLLPVTCFVALGFEHSVANMFILPFGSMFGQVPIAGALGNLMWVTAGNVIGGFAFAMLARDAS